MWEDFERQMRDGAEQLDIHLSREQLWRYHRFFEMLVEKNKVMNLTAITEEKDVIAKHFLDSLSIVMALPGLKNGKAFSIIDVGTGAGFPGIPLRIAFSSCDLLLLDSLNKRVDFLKEVCSSLELDRVRFVHGRAEDVGRDKSCRERFDVCVSRAVADLSVLSEYCLPFVKIGGVFISYKSRNVEKEVKGAQDAIKLLGGTVRSVEAFCLPGTEMERSLVVVEKEKHTQMRYPRKAGIPSKEPLR